MDRAYRYKRNTLIFLAFISVVLSSNPAQSAQPIINEFVIDHAGTPVNEYVEILGAANTSYFNVWVLSIEGDNSENPGAIDAAVRFRTSDTNGIVTTRYLTMGTLGKGTSTLLLVTNFTGSVGNDIDPGNVGSMTDIFWDQLIDSVAVSDGGPDGTVYSDVVLGPGFDGNGSIVSGASRFPNGAGSNSVSQWVRNDFDAEGIPGFTGTLDPGTEALNTPAAPNRRNYANGGGDAPQGVRIHHLQGIRHRSELEGQRVTDVMGLVTAVSTSSNLSQGFYMQDEFPDNDPRSSEGIFVFTGSTNPSDLGVQAGTLVEVDGVVEEERPSANVDNLTTTRIRSHDNPATQITVLGNSSTLNPTMIGRRGLLPPTKLISTFKGYVEDSAALNLSEGQDFYESLEGMLLKIKNPRVVSPSSRFGEVWVLADRGVGASGRNKRGGITIREKDSNPERIQIANGIVDGVPSDLNVGAKLESVIGILRYSNFSNYVLDPVAPLVVKSNNLPRETTKLRPRKSGLTIANFNVENLDPSDGTRFDQLGDIIANNLQGPDIIALDEVQDNNGTVNDGTVAADQTFSDLIAAIERANPRLLNLYDFTQIDPEDGKDGGQPGGNIRVGFLFRTDRVSLATGIKGDATTNTTVLPGPRLSLNPGRVLDGNLDDGDIFQSSRKPLAAEFLFHGENGPAKVFVIAIHFVAKGGDQPLFGPSQPPELISEPQRTQQAQLVNDFVDDILAENPRANVVVLGDFNDFQFSIPQRTLRGIVPNDKKKRLPRFLKDLTGHDWATKLFASLFFDIAFKIRKNSPVLKDLVSSLKPTDQYSFVFRGNSLALDNIHVSRNLARFAKADAVHVNSEFFDQASDHDPVLAQLFPGTRLIKNKWLRWLR